MFEDEKPAAGNQWTPGAREQTTEPAGREIGAALEAHVRCDINDSTGAQWQETEGEHNGGSRGAGVGLGGTNAGQDEDRHIVWVWAGNLSGGKR